MTTYSTPPRWPDVEPLPCVAGLSTGPMTAAELRCSAAACFERARFAIKWARQTRSNPDMRYADKEAPLRMLREYHKTARFFLREAMAREG